MLINEFLTTPFKMEKGLRQCNLLSPFLFVLVTKMFSQLIHRAQGLVLCKGLEIGQDKLILINLLFADDTLIFLLAEKQALTNMRRVLDLFTLLRALIKFGKADDWGLKWLSNWAVSS